MERIAELIARKIEAKLDAKLDGILDTIIESALARILGVGVEVEVPKRVRKAKTVVPEVKVTATPEAKAEAEPKAKAKTAEAEAKTDQLLARLERVASGLGEHYGPMLLRRARSLAKHSQNPTSALAVMVAWAEGVPAEEIVAVLRGSERLPDGTTISGWRLMAAKLGIPVKDTE